MPALRTVRGLPGAGVVHCEVLDVQAPQRLRHTWRGDEDADDVTEATYLLEPTATGTRFTGTQSGFTGLAISRLLGRVRRRMPAEGVPPVLAEYRSRSVGVNCPSLRRAARAGEMRALAR